MLIGMRRRPPKTKEKITFVKSTASSWFASGKHRWKKLLDTDVIVPSRNFKKSDMDTLVRRIFFELYPN